MCDPEANDMAYIKAEASDDQGLPASLMVRCDFSCQSFKSKINDKGVDNGNPNPWILSDERKPEINKNGDHTIVWGTQEGWGKIECYYDEKRKEWGVEDGLYFTPAPFTPTHWMYIPHIPDPIF